MMYRARFGAALVDDSVKRIDPLAGFLRIGVRELARQAIADHRALAFGGHSVPS
jgi:hypothetical protein